MPRNGSGVYTLPPSNPVVPFTTIETNWANPTMTDIATALTDSLSRTGQGGMTAPFRIADGTIGAPGLAFTNETSLGFYRATSGVMSSVSGGSATFNFLADGVSSPVRADFYGFTTYRFTGTYNWKVYDDAAGNYRIQPSTLVNGDIYDAAKGLWIAPATGLVTVSSLNVVGAIAAGTWTFSAINCTTLHATGSMSSDAGMSATFMQANQNVINPQITTGASATTINFNVSQSWVVTLSAPLTITAITGLTAGNIGRITFKGTTNAVTFPSTVKWPAPSFAKPDFAAGPLDICVVVLEYDGTNFLANAAVY